MSRNKTPRTDASESAWPSDLKLPVYHPFPEDEDDIAAKLAKPERVIITEDKLASMRHSIGVQLIPFVRDSLKRIESFVMTDGFELKFEQNDLLLAALNLGRRNVVDLVRESGILKREELMPMSTVRFANRDLYFAWMLIMGADDDVRAIGVRMLFGKGYLVFYEALRRCLKSFGFEKLHVYGLTGHKLHCAVADAIAMLCRQTWIRQFGLRPEKKDVDWAITQNRRMRREHDLDYDYFITM